MSRPWGWKNYSFLQFGIWSENRGERNFVCCGVQGVIYPKWEPGESEIMSRKVVIVAIGVVNYFCEEDLARIWQLLLVNGIDEEISSDFSNLSVMLDGGIWGLRVGRREPPERTCWFREFPGHLQAHSGDIIPTETGSWDGRRYGGNKGLKSMVWYSYGPENCDITRVSILRDKGSRPLEPLLFTHPLPYQRARTVVKVQKDEMTKKRRKEEKKRRKKEKSLFYR
jgi:hypothetical protein